MKINEQIDIFSSASVVISASGSALTNIIFCPKGSEIIEIIFR